MRALTIAALCATVGCGNVDRDNADVFSDGGAGGEELTLEPVRVIRGESGQTGWVDLTIRGEGLSRYEGALVTLRIGSPDRPPERLGSAQALIRNGRFEVVFPDVLHRNLYVRKAVGIDTDANGRCEVAVDRVFTDSRAARVDGAPEVLVVKDAANERGPFDMGEGDAANGCAILNAEWPTR